MLRADWLAALLADQTVVSAEQPVVSAEQPVVSAEQPMASADQTVVLAEQPAVDLEVVAWAAAWVASVVVKVQREASAAKVLSAAAVPWEALAA